MNDRMTNDPPRDDATVRNIPDLTREESLHLDGALGAEEARRLEEALAADPRRRERLAAWRTAAALWRDDATRAARGLDPEALARRVVVAAAARDPEAEARASLAYRRYARAAVVLLALGGAGTVWMASVEARTADVARGGRDGQALDAVERQRLRMQGTLEILALPVARPDGSPTGKGG